MTSFICYLLEFIYFVSADCVQSFTHERQKIDGNGLCHDSLQFTEQLLENPTGVLCVVLLSNYGPRSLCWFCLPGDTAGHVYITNHGVIFYISWTLVDPQTLIDMQSVPSSYHCSLSRS